MHVCVWVGSSTSQREEDSLRAQPQVRIYIYVWVYVYIYVCLFVYIYICIHIYIYIHIHIHTHIYRYVYICIYIYICLSVCECVFIYLCICKIHPSPRLVSLSLLTHPLEPLTHHLASVLWRTEPTPRLACLGTDCPVQDILSLRSFLALVNIPLLPPPSALLTRLQYQCTTDAQYTTPTRPPLCMPYTIQDWQRQYRAKAKAQRDSLRARGPPLPQAALLIQAGGGVEPRASPLVTTNIVWCMAY